MAEAPRILLEHHLKRLKLPTFLREYEKLARQCAAEGLDHVQFLARLVELELIDRERRLVERRIKQDKVCLGRARLVIPVQNLDDAANLVRRQEAFARIEMRVELRTQDTFRQPFLQLVKQTVLGEYRFRITPIQQLVQ